jgi:hypothetical protein
LQRETASIVTDATRSLLLRAVGYESWALELVPTEHTPKNTLLRAKFRGSSDGAALQHCNNTWRSKSPPAAQTSRSQSG